MKMGCFLFSGFFWGIVLILLGLSLIIKVIFNINLPIFRIGFAVLIIYVGIKILVGGRLCCFDNNFPVFNDTSVELKDLKNNEYNVIFGKGVIDLSKASIQDKKIDIKINTVFGEGIVKINPELPIKIFVNSAFAEARMPDGNRISFGNYTYTSKTFKEDAKHLKINASVVFGSLKIIQ